MSENSVRAGRAPATIVAEGVRSPKELPMAMGALPSGTTWKSS
ncbi:hypothetical protein ACIP5Y_46520 [Nocardia sp. NPDC088792]